MILAKELLKMRTVFVLVDALRSDYLSPQNMPFLYDLACRNLYVRKVIPSFGYCERTEIFTGMRPDKSGNFTAIGYDPQRSEYKKYRLLFNILEPFERFDKKRICRRVFSRLLRNTEKKMQIYQIPFSDIYKFRLTEDYNSHYVQGAFCKESFFDVANREKLVVVTDAFTALGEENRFSSIDERVQFVCSQKDADFDCLLVYIPIIDSMGHLYTNQYDLMQVELKKVDKLIENIYNELSSVEDTRFMFLGDHGMEPITDKIDVWSKINEIGLKRGRDYDIFLDSTIARFWTKNEKCKEILEERLSTGDFPKKGFLVDEEIAQKLHIPYLCTSEHGNRLYGDLIWAANNGVLISPDYFNYGKNITGMHSYPQKSILSSGLAVVAGIPHSPRIIEECELVDICPTLCSLVGIPFPNGNEGISLIQPD